MPREWTLGLKFIKGNWFWFAISLYLTLGLYMLNVTYSTTFLSIAVEERNGNWLVSNPYYKDWAAKQHISPGDIILSVDGIKVDDVSNIKYDYVIRAAKELTIKKSEGYIMNIRVNNFDIPQQFYYVLIIPTFHFFLTLPITLYTYRKSKNLPSANLLIMFILTVSLSYVSIGASGRLDNLGIIINRSSMLLCLVLLLHFLKHYFSFLNLKWLFVSKIKVLYIIPFSGLVLGVFSVIYPGSNIFISYIVLWIFLLLLLINLFIIMVGYSKYKTPQLKVMLISIVIPFLPFIFLYAFPNILFQKYILSAEICALFLMLIPFSFIFTQLTERIFDMEYLITRIRYYLGLSFIFTIWLVLGIYMIADYKLSIANIVEIFIFASISLTLFFYLKEKVDYLQRKVLFSTKGDYIHQLYTTIDKVGKAYKMGDLLDTFSNEVSLHLELNSVSVVTYDYQSRQFIKNNDAFDLIHNQLDLSIIEKLQLGEIKRVDSFYLAFIHQDFHYKRVLVLNHHNTIRLKDEELLWLELLLLYLNNFIDNTKMIEGLMEELKQMRQVDGGQLPWLNKLLWLRFEEEKYQLAQELHDTNLQEQLHIAREVDVLAHVKDVSEVRVKLAEIHEQMISSIDELRVYCENLKPPLLDTMGLNAALEKLIQKIALRADFALTYTIDRLYLDDERLNLVIYRVFQELLNNALKHSFATSVEIHLKEMSDGFEIIYMDNGVGCELQGVIHSESMGITGMQERVKAFNGQFSIVTSLHEGMSIRITIKEESESLDYDAHSG